MKSPSASMTFWICVANSLVGESINTWVSRSVVSSDCRIDIEKVAVLPVPDCAWAITSRPLTIGMILLCWIADGFSKPKKEKQFCRYINEFKSILGNLNLKQVWRMLYIGMEDIQGTFCVIALGLSWHVSKPLYVEGSSLLSSLCSSFCIQIRSFRNFALIERFREHNK